MKGSVDRCRADVRDRISELPVEILDHIMGFLPVQQAAKTAVLSKVWRDVWFSLTRLCFHVIDDNFFRYFNHKYRAGSECLEESLLFYVISKVLLEHKGSIRKFECRHSSARAETVRSRSFDMDQWLLLVTQQGVEEISLHFGLNEYKLPVCIFSCSTLRRLDLYGLLIEPPQDSQCAFPNVTSLSFRCVQFRSRNPSGYVVDVPKLENLSFIHCEDMFLFNINARNLCTLTIECWYTTQLGKFLPENLDLRSIRTLEMDNYTLQDFLGQYTTNGIALQLPLLNVELLKLSEFCFLDNAIARVSAFVCLLCRCPKLRNLEIKFESRCVEDVYKFIDTTSRDLKKSPLCFTEAQDAFIFED
ncbi:unnamed protein product [Cuscuta campestris]|uniref:F-box domain-containing protein n=1 Tax=Cuscuta campestris TaxID=132261 RepID=A0A484NQQ2_9ASTE|nr:unnamed protein product [Cuscuta campestris]